MAQSVIEKIKKGENFTYRSGYPINSKRMWTISVNKLGTFVITANDLKSKTILTESQVLEIINNI